MSFFARLRPGNTPAHVLEKQDELLTLRDRLLQFILNTGAILASVAYLYFWINPVTRQRSLTLYFFSGVLVVVYLLTFLRRIHYSLRANLTLLIFFGAAVFGMTQQGVSGSSVLFLTAFIVLSGLLLGLGGSIRAGILAMASFLGMGISIQLGWMPVPALEQMYLSNSFSAWGLKAAFLLAVASTLVASAYTLVNGLLKSTAEQRSLANRLQHEQSQLNAMVEERTLSLQRRLKQIITTVEIGHVIGELHNPEMLLQQIVDLIRERFDLYYVGVFLLDDRKENVILRAGTGEAGQAMVASHHQLAVGGSSMIGWATANRKPRIALDTGQESVRFDNPYLPATRSELAIPILAHQSLLGALTIQSEQPSAFDEQDILIFHGIADSLGIALENGRLLEDAQRNLEEIEALNRSYLLQAWDETARAAGELKYTFTNPAAASGALEHSIQVPLTVRDQKIGHLTLETHLAQLSPEEFEFAEAVAAQTALALENARLLQETRQHAMSEEKLNQLSAQFSRSIGIEEILQMAVQELGQLPAVSEVTVQLAPKDPASQRYDTGEDGKAHA